MGLFEIAKYLLDIPVNPLRDPSVPGNDEWHVSMNISHYEFADTWKWYLDVLRRHGRVCRSEFAHVPLPRDELPAPPREQTAVTIDVKLLFEEWPEQLYFVVTIYATGRVECLVRDEERYRDLSN